MDMPIGDQCRLVAHAEADHQSVGLAREQLLHCGTARSLHGGGDPDPGLWLTAPGVTHQLVGGAGEAHMAGGGLEGAQAAEAAEGDSS